MPLAMKHTGQFTSAYHRNYPLTEFARAGENLARADAGGEYSYDCITEVCFEDRAALDAMFAALADPRIGPVIAADEDEFIDKASMRALLCETTSREQP
ncbi:MAG: EthD domain-containing protein [Steroidobacteraceae bacterium]